MTEPAPRLCAYTDQTCQNDDDQYYIRFITEGRAGWTPSRETFPDLLEARARASIFNHLTQRLTVDQVRHILDTQPKAVKP